MGDHPKSYFDLKFQNFDDIFKNMKNSNQNRASGGPPFDPLGLRAAILVFKNLTSQIKQDFRMLSYFPKWA